MKGARGNAVSSNKSARTFAPLLLLVTLVAASAATTQHAKRTKDAGGRQAGADTFYRVISLAPGLLATIPDINAKGQVTFSMQGPAGAIGYFYDGTLLRDIGSLGGNDVLAVDLNDLGQVTGSATSRSGVKRAFIWSAGAGMRDIGALPGTNESEAAAINNRGDVTGASNASAFRWSAATGIKSLDASSSGPAGASFGTALNDAGIIAGGSQFDANNRHAFRWTSSRGLIDIDRLDSVDAIPVCVGARGEVAGNRLAPGPASLYRPFMWTPAKGMVDLGTGGGTEALIVAATPDMQLAGHINLADATQRAMSWTPATGMRRLDTLGGRSSGASDVNARGQVVGYAENKTGRRRAFVWTAARGMRDLNNFLRVAPSALVLDAAVSINDQGTIVATSNAGLVLLRPLGEQWGRRAPGTQRRQRSGSSTPPAH